jgi:hypothetical protein
LISCSSATDHPMPRATVPLPERTLADMVGRADHLAEVAAG